MKYRVFEKVELWKESIIEVRDYYGTIDKVIQAYKDNDIDYIDSKYLIETEEIVESSKKPTREIWNYKHEDHPLWTNALPKERSLFEECDLKNILKQNVG